LSIEVACRARSVVARNRSANVAVSTAASRAGADIPGDGDGSRSDGSGSLSIAWPRARWTQSSRPAAERSAVDPYPLRLASMTRTPTPRISDWSTWRIEPPVSAWMLNTRRCTP
jgi:hypothetical protein